MALNGGKAYLAKEIIKLMPPKVKNPNAPDKNDRGYIAYVEPYFGGGAVLLQNDPTGISEVANDINTELTRFWQVLQCPVIFEDFKRRIEATPFSEWEYENSCKNYRCRSDDDDPLDQAVDFFIRCRMSLAGRMKSFTGITKTRVRRGMNNETSAWLTAIEGLPAVHERLKRVLILNRDAIDAIKSQDGPQTLFYADPTYVHETRASTGEYEHEMGVHHHEELLATLADIKGKFLLSGYRCPLYDEWATKFNFRRHDFEMPNHAAGGKEKRIMTESVWLNY